MSPPSWQLLKRCLPSENLAAASCCWSLHACRGCNPATGSKQLIAGLPKRTGPAEENNWRKRKLKAPREKTTQRVALERRKTLRPEAAAFNWSGLLRIWEKTTG